MDEEESTCIFGCMFVGCQYSQSLQQFDRRRVVTNFLSGG